MFIRHAIVLVGSLAGLSVILNATHPDSIPISMLMTVFGLMYLVVLEIGLICVLGLRELKIVRRDYAKMRRIVVWVAALPVFLLVLQSIGQLTLRDVLLAGGLFVMLYFYFSRLTVANS